LGDNFDAELFPAAGLDLKFVFDAEVSALENNFLDALDNVADETFFVALEVITCFPFFEEEALFCGVDELTAAFCPEVSNLVLSADLLLLPFFAFVLGVPLLSGPPL
jgi:hypothetical protein